MLVALGKTLRSSILEGQISPVARNRIQRPVKPSLHVLSTGQTVKQFCSILTGKSPVLGEQKLLRAKTPAN